MAELGRRFAASGMPDRPRRPDGSCGATGCTEPVEYEVRFDGCGVCGHLRRPVCRGGHGVCADHAAHLRAVSYPWFGPIAEIRTSSGRPTP